MNKKYVGLAVLVIILVVAIGWNLYFQSAPPRILKKYFGIPQDSPIAQIVLVVVILVVIGIAYAVTRKRR